ncbi:glycosyltransferase family 1 protein, partial [Candidatus Dependentiae bacterium]|nr:glycosyltransferase family 1 protein [Candidatus Dependentiae bacterium]
PVVLSNRSSFPEIALDAGVYFEPENVESIVESIEKIFIDKNLKLEKISIGLKRAHDFSWQKTASKTKEIYKSIL